MARRFSVWLALLAVLTLVQPVGSPTGAVVLAGPAAGADAAPAAQGRQDATLRLDWVPTPHHVGPAMAQDRGYYLEEGINLRIGEGTGSGVTVQAVTGGQDTFGFADAATMTVAVSRGAPVRMVANSTGKSPIGVIYLPSTTIDRPQDLAGKTIGAAAGDASVTALPAVARVNGVNPDSYRVVTIEAATKVPALLERRVDAIVGFRFGDYLRAFVINPDVRIHLYSDWGVNTLGNGYLAHERTLRERPDLVRGFVRATMRGWKDAQADPQAGVAALVRLFPTANEDHMRIGLPMVLEHFYSPNTAGRPLGWMSDQDWQQTVSVLREYGGMEGNPTLASLFTNDFVPTE